MIRFRFFAFWTMQFLKVNEKPTNALIIQYIGTQYSPTCFGPFNLQRAAGGWGFGGRAAGGVK
jgi:hypothetical protein